MNKNDQMLPTKSRDLEEIKQDKVLKKLSNISLMSSMSLITRFPGLDTSASIKHLEYEK
jgi:hypothetical protein